MGNPSKYFEEGPSQYAVDNLEESDCPPPTRRPASKRNR